MCSLLVNNYLYNLFCCYAAGSGGGGQADMEDVARLQVELEMKEQELREKNESISQLVS